MRRAISARRQKTEPLAGSARGKFAQGTADRMQVKGEHRHDFLVDPLVDPALTAAIYAKRAKLGFFLPNHVRFRDASA